MAYATQADVEKTVGVDALAAFAYDDDLPDVVSASVVSDALDEASDTADGYIAAYLPLTTTPKALRRAVVDIAVNAMRESRDKATEDSRARAKAAMEWLRDVAKGTAKLVTPTEGVTDTGEPEISAGTRVWSRYTARGVF